MPIRKSKDITQFSSIQANTIGWHQDNKSIKSQIGKSIESHERHPPQKEDASYMSVSMGYAKGIVFSLSEKIAKTPLGNDVLVVTTENSGTRINSKFAKPKKKSGLKNKMVAT